MSSRLDANRAEGPRLEYKSAAALKDTSRIARAVAAMLNAKGGEIWIGVRAEAEVPVEIEGVEDAARARRSLEDALCDLLEPPWSAELGTIEEVPHGARALLVVVCRENAGGGPFAVLGRDGREFLTRAGARVRRMSREELARAFSKPRDPRPDGEAMRIIEDFRGLVTDRKRFPDRFWMLATPGTPMTLPFDDDSFRANLHQTLVDPARSGNRPQGFTVVNRFATIDLRAEAAWIGADDDAHWSLRIDHGGTLSFHVPLDVLAFNLPFRKERALWPYVLCELPASFLRLLDALYQLAGVDDETPILFDMGLTGAEAWTLGPHSPDALGYRTNARAFDRDALLWSDPLRFTRRELRQRDAIALRAVSRIYREWGHDGDFLPREWNRDTKRLELPD
ncbi:MAG: ATP-binding protein [Planctomycetes bacterium]|nr:ATP-binding protein [Planctomycetota bacterium]